MEYIKCMRMKVRGILNGDLANTPTANPRRCRHRYGRRCSFVRGARLEK